MKHAIKYAFWLLFIPWSTLQAQDTLFIRDVLTVPSNKELVIAPGTVVCFMSNAKIWLEGGLLATGTADKPVIFCSANVKHPGTGIYINGSNRNKKILIEHASFLNLLQPLSFETFWARKSVTLNYLLFQGSAYHENVLMAGGPLIDQKAAPITFSLRNSEFVNNTAGIIFDQVGAPGYELQLDSLYFNHNYRQGNGETLGMLHLNMAENTKPANIHTGILVMNENYADDELLGLSVSGQNAEINSVALYTAGKQRLIYDYSSDNRLPKWETPLYDLSELKKVMCLPGKVVRTKDKILLPAFKNCAFKNLQDSLLHTFQVVSNIQNDTLWLDYSYKKQARINLQNGISIPVPAVPAVSDSQELAMIRMQENMEMNIDTLKTYSDPFVKTFEAGVLGGLAFYIGDIKHKFGIPGTYEWSGGIYFQYNHSPLWMFRSSFYKTNIGMHDPQAPVMIWQSASTYVQTDNGYSERKSWENNFVTKMTVLDLDANYRIKQAPINWKQRAQTIGYWTIDMGMGIGIMYFEPYRHAFYTTEKEEDVLIKLRPLGTEGQNFLIGKHKYNQYALNFNASFQLCYTYKRFKIRYEFKSVLSTSDYLDDYGQGYTYGGNYNKWKASVGDIQLPIDPKTGKQVVLESIFPDYNAQSIRTNNLLPDMYFQSHIGIGYDLGALFLKKGNK